MLFRSIADVGRHAVTPAAVAVMQPAPLPAKSALPIATPPEARDKVVAGQGHFVAEHLESIAKRFPPGPRAKDLMGELNLPYHEVLRIVNFVDSIGKGQWVYVGGESAKRLVPPNVCVDVKLLTDIQERVLGALASHVDEHNCVCQIGRAHV